jgi:hypothetical protein
MDNFTQKYNIDRKAASRLLKVSVRTVDRYIKKKVLVAQNIGGRIWLNKDDVLGLTNKPTPQTYEPQTIDTSVDMSTGLMTIDTTHDTERQKQENLSTQVTEKIERTSDTSHLFKELYENTKTELREKEERLEIANYRVGQLEAQLKNSVPLLEYHRESHEKKLEKARLVEKIEQTESRLAQIIRKLRFEEYNRKILFTILLIILALQPLWLLLLKK